jgi:oxygen-independent coproporphyrinogen-3 oxidase
MQTSRSQAKVNRLTVRHLYVHVPFCRAKCDYCEFYSVRTHCGEAASAPGGAADDGFGGCSDPELDRYLHAVLAELELERRAGAVGRLRTVFLGGGTPSLLGEERLERLLSVLEPLLTPHAEVTVETNPEDVTPAYAEWASRRRIRVSLGVQSFDARLRGVLGRRAEADPAKAYERLRAAGVMNMGIDLIFGIPGQGAGDLKRELDQVARLQPDHVSWYELSAPQGTPLAARLAAGDVALPDDDQQAALFRSIVRGLGTLGYRWYEVSNFARPGRRCRHNSAVWRAESYLGLGPAAVGTVGDLRRQDRPDLAAYLDALAPRGGAEGGARRAAAAVGGRNGEDAGGGGWPVAPPGRAGRPGVPTGARPLPVAPPRTQERLSAAVRAYERLMLAARTGATVPLSELDDCLDRAALPALVKAGFVREAGGTLRVTRKGRHVANAVCVRLFRDSCLEGTNRRGERPPESSSSPEVTT